MLWLKVNYNNSCELTFCHGVKKKLVNHSNRALCDDFQNFLNHQNAAKFVCLWVNSFLVNKYQAAETLATMAFASHTFYIEGHEKMQKERGKPEHDYKED